MSLMKQAAARKREQATREVEPMLALIQADASTVISVAEAMRIKTAFKKQENVDLKFFEHPSELVEEVHALLN